MIKSLFGYAPWLLFAIVISLIAQWWKDSGFIVLLVSVMLYLLVQYRQYEKLARWFVSGSKLSHFPDISGAWSQVGGYAYKLKKQNQQRKKNLAKIVKRFHRSTRAMPDASVVFNENFEIEWANKAARHLLGIHPSLDVGHRINNLLRAPEFNGYLASGNYSSSVEIVSPIDKSISVVIRIVPYDFGRFILMARDISERKRIDAMRKDFVANVSHEFRTPLTVLQGYCESLAMDCTEPFQVKAFEAAQRQINRMNDLVDDLIHLSRYENDVEIVEGRPVQVAQLVSNIAVQLEEQGVHLEYHVDSDLILKCEPADLEMVLNNLLFNAIKHNEGSVNIEIKAGVDELGAYITVKDDGVGIAQEHLLRLTERFYRVDTGQSKTTGSGLGLAIVKHILKRHEAVLRISSTLGKGAEFTCEFPIERVVKEGAINDLNDD